jgi:ParB/RepB/Spo0J family partition protein
MINLELHQLDLRHEHLRRRSTSRERRLIASIAHVGQQTPIVVVACDAGRHIVIDGFKRVRALRRLGCDTIRATTWALEECEALLLEKILHDGDADSALEQGWFLKELRERFGLGLDELAQRFDRSASWVSRRLALVDALPEVIRDKVRGGQIGPHVAMKYLAPLARANEEHCTRFVDSIAPLHLTSRQISTLYSAYFATTAAGRELLVDQPQLFLRIENETKRADDCGREPKEQVLLDLAHLAAVARVTEPRV